MELIQKIGHRGAKGHLAENTLESIAKALEFGVDSVEIDVHRCLSGELVVIHDFTLDRTTNGSGDVDQKSLSELKSFLVEEKYRIPLLTEVLDLIVGKCKINIELKGSNTATATCEIIKASVDNGNWKYSDVIVSSFQQKELLRVFEINPEVPIGILSKASISEAIELGIKLKAKAIHPSIGIISRSKVLECQEKGFDVNVWTVNEHKAISRMKKFGVTGIISDYPDWL
ncbi:glycerophosphodiester phosphodiesterase [Antarcticibacterium sp. 1MA-6-2]|uniref:glycerophosphodiester phosphodiesterase n=1 Tax=Antarcticibacterium sp. 1MA-6-2 TaxID=2908210 RepID=UPI001F1F39D1|nr:glycerophosphodiester phosphodiesterase family protein [Antarcticibacterium sp. 1MA-6-2]UJH89906.1 glycerophosphodiester phosphodiesterase [Antarcticibacterium sp. 1MA-6-2]